VAQEINNIGFGPSSGEIIPSSNMGLKRSVEESEIRLGLMSQGIDGRSPHNYIDMEAGSVPFVFGREAMQVGNYEENDVVFSERMNLVKSNIRTWKRKARSVAVVGGNNLVRLGSRKKRKETSDKADRGRKERVKKGRRNEIDQQDEKTVQVEAVV
jgi:hypothetical protein